jgi:FKBP-type peptidyl-prolyl cis-trans isomerase 2
MTIATGDSVTITYTGRLEDGTVFDTTDEAVAEEAGLREEQPDREFEPITVEVGAGNLIEGMEAGLLDLEEGDSETIRVPPEEAYGEADDDSVRQFDAEQFEEMVGQEPVEGLQVRAQGGAAGTVVDVGEGVVAVDFEHPLAGETLIFDVDVLAVE